MGGLFLGYAAATFVVSFLIAVAWHLLSGDKTADRFWPRVGKTWLIVGSLGILLIGGFCAFLIAGFRNIP